MHMGDALLSPIVGGITTAAGVGMIAYSAKKISSDLQIERKIPLMGVMGAFIFAGQMVNFTIPLTGSSGHIGGGILLASVLGEFPALLTLACVLLIQSLFFADGGLLAYGANVINMGVLPILIAYPLIFRPIIRKGITKPRLIAASVLSAVVGLQLGALGVVLETLSSGITALNFGHFAVLMMPIHLAIGLGEGIVTALVLAFIHSVSPELLGVKTERPVKSVLPSILAVSLIVAGVVSIFASGNPDGLEWSVAGASALEEAEETASLLSYDSSVAKIVGTLITVAAAVAIGFAMSLFKKKKKCST